jgi:glutamate:Na+ symporter, ESS family
VLQLNLIHTLAFGGIALLAGYGLRRWIPVLGRLNMPAAVLGGLLVSMAAWIGHARGVQLFQFDTTLQSPLMIAFFTTVGFGASLSLLRVGGPLVLKFLLLASGFAVLQNVLGIALALLFGLPPLFGLLAGSVTLTGGPATGLAFAPLFEQAGVNGAASIAVAMGMAGIVSGALSGSPVATWLVHRHGLQGRRVSGAQPRAGETLDGALQEESLPVSHSGTTGEDDDETFPLLKNIIALLVAMWAGSWVSQLIAATGFTMPPYIGAMLVATLLRNLDDRFGWFGLSARTLDTLGAVALSLFLVVALMNLKLWELAGLALPLVVILAAQVVMAAVGAVFVFGRMGRDYESAVMSGGFIGFMLGTTANAMAVMRSLVERYGPAPRAFLVAPLVGAFFIDFVNALLITLGINLFK